ncbi:MAG: response regulator [Gemmatimonadaceae bacterium]|nr:response regulator [Gemmatimonadaceae bacterium]
MPKRVLIIEDEMSIRESLADLFASEGVAVVVAASLDEAKESLFGAAEFDLIVTDLRLGSKRDGGLQVMAAAGLVAPMTPVIVLTAYPDDDNRQASLRLGATYFLEKPVDLSVIAGIATKHGVPSAIEPVTVDHG